MKTMKNIDTDNFAQIASCGRPAVLDFWAPWCGPCRMLAPTFEELSDEFAGKAEFGKVNVDDNPGLAQQFAIQYIPAVVVVDGGIEKGRLVGMHSKEELSAFISTYVK